MGSELDKCVRCGACRQVCPVFKTSRLERDSARGKLSLIRACSKGDLPLTPVFRKSIDHCILCLNCVSNCSNNVRVDRIILAARARFKTSRGLPLWKTAAFWSLRNPKRVDCLLKSGSIAQTLFFKALPDDTGLKLRFPLSPVSKPSYVPAITRRPFRNRNLKTVQWDTARDSVTFFTGCMTNYIFPALGEAVLKVMAALEIHVTIPEEQKCCGAPAKTSGDTPTATLLARHNINCLFAADKTSCIIVPCASCGYMLKTVYPDLFASDPEMSAMAKQLSDNVFEITEYLVKRVGLEAVSHQLKSSATRKITYHDPCHLRCGMGVISEPRDILKLVAGKNFTEMEDADQCCGSGGLFRVNHPETARLIFDSKSRHIKQSRAEIIATGCPACMMQLRNESRNRNISIHTAHPIEILAAHL